MARRPASVTVPPAPGIGAFGLPENDESDIAPVVHKNQSVCRKTSNDSKRMGRADHSTLVPTRGHRSLHRTYRPEPRMPSLGRRLETHGTAIPFLGLRHLPGEEGLHCSSTAFRRSGQRSRVEEFPRTGPRQRDAPRTAVDPDLGLRQLVGELHDAGHQHPTRLRLGMHKM